MQSSESIPSARIGPIGAAARPVPQRRGALRQALIDLGESFARVARQTRWPTWRGLMNYLGHQALANTLAWSAGLLTAGLMKRYFAVRGIHNLWGLLASRERTLLSPDDYEMIELVLSYGAGLVMLMLVRHLVLRVIAEFHALRSERKRSA